MRTREKGYALIAADSGVECAENSDIGKRNNFVTIANEIGVQGHRKNAADR